MRRVYGISSIACGIASFYWLIVPINLIHSSFPYLFLIFHSLLPIVALTLGYIGIYDDDSKWIAIIGLNLGMIALILLPLSLMVVLLE
jgi:hypothetical protein